MSHPYRRFSDRQIVSADEALDASGAIRSGYGPTGSMQPGDHIGFNMAFFGDSQPTGSRVYMTDANLSDPEIDFRNSPEGREFVALARANFYTSNPPATSGRTWTEEMASDAIKAEYGKRVGLRKSAVDAAIQRPGLMVAADAALAAHGLRTSRTI